MPYGERAAYNSDIHYGLLSIAGTMCAQPNMQEWMASQTRHHQVYHWVISLQVSLSPSGHRFLLSKAQSGALQGFFRMPGGFQCQCSQQTVADSGILKRYTLGVLTLSV